MIVEQFLPAFHYGDAIGNSALSFHRFLQAKGIESRIIAMTIDESLEELAMDFNAYKEKYPESPGRETIRILHYAVPSDLTYYFLQAGGKKVMIYHNITPPHFFADYCDYMVRFTSEGRKQLEELSDCFDLSIAVSQYNAEDLKDLNFKNVRVSPLMINLSDYQQPYSKAYCNLLQDDRKNIIFVGRIMPNKKIEDLIKVLFFYKKYLNPSIRLIIAGNTRALPKYFNAVRDLASRFYLTAEDIFFTGHIPFAELLSVYRLADVFLSMSEHEGFCLPLIESSYLKTPVVAFDAGAVAETLDGSGILFKEKNPDKVAGLVEQVLTDQPLQEKLVGLQGERIQKYKRDSEPEKLFALLQEL